MPGSFQEVGGLTGQGRYVDGKLVGVTPAPYVMGLAAIDGRPVAIGGEDFTVRGGTSWSGDRKKGGQGGFVEDLAASYRIPLVNLIDGSGGSVTSINRRGHAVFPGVHGFERSVELMGKVPVVSAVLGTAAGGPAGRAILSHWSVMVEGTSQVFAAGPPVVERSLGQKITKEDLGGAGLAVDLAGTIDNRAATEAECFALIRRFLSYMPQNVWELPPAVLSTDPVDRCEDALLRIVPNDRRRPYNMRRLVKAIVDRDSLFEIQPTFGKAVITGLARMNGKVVGVIANNPMIYGGAMDVKAARKQTHFIELCDCFHIPLVFFVDVPGFMVGKDAEEAATLREGMRAVYVGLQATVPMFTVVVRKCYGMAGMGSHRQERHRLQDRVAVGRVGLAADRGRRRCRLPARDRGRARSQGPRARDRGRAPGECLAVPHSRGFRRRGHHRSARDATLSVPFHRCGPGQPQNQPRAQTEVWRAPLRCRYARLRITGANAREWEDIDDA